MEEDINLVGKYLAGDENAIEELVMKYQRQIYSFVYRMIDDMEEAKDLTQKTFIKAIRGIRGFRGESSFKTWLYQIAMNTSLNHLSQIKREEVELEESIIGNQAGALSEIMEKEKKILSRRALRDCRKDRGSQ